MKYTDFIKKIDNEFFPIIIIAGEDSFLREDALNKLKISLNLQLEDLNFSSMSGDKTTVTDILALADAYPVMDNHRMIVVYDFDYKTASQIKSWKKFEIYCKNPNPSTCLVFVYDNDNVTQVLLPNENKVDCTRLNIYEVVDWIIDNVKASGKTIDRQSAQRIAEYTDRNMYLVVQSIKKLFAYCKETIDLQSIELLVSKDIEYVVFAITDAISANDNCKAMEVCKQLLIDTDAEKVMYTIYSSFRRMFYSVITPVSVEELAKRLSVKPYAITQAKLQGAKFGAIKLKKALDYCQFAEKSLKNFDGNDKSIVFDLVLKLCNL